MKNEYFCRRKSKKDVSVIVKKLIENLAAEGLQGEVAAINGLELQGEDLSVHKGLKVRKHITF